MDKRKETVAKILKLLDGLTYNNSRQILDDVAIKLGEVKITTSSTENGATAHSAEQMPTNFWAAVVRERCDKCPGRDARYSAILAEL